MKGSYKEKWETRHDIMMHVFLSKILVIGCALPLARVAAQC